MNTDRTSFEDQKSMELIDRFLLGQLTPEEVRQFRIQLDGEDGLRARVEEQRQEMYAVEEHGIRQAMADFHKGLPEENLPSRHRVKWWMLAASVLLLLGMSFWALWLSESSTEQLYSKYFRPDPGLPTTMGTTSDYEFYSGMVSYKQKKYSEAILQWKPLYEANPKNDTFTYFLGVAHLADGNPKKAGKYLELAKRIENGAFSEETNYYLALVYLKENKVQQAIAVLKNSSHPDNRALLQALKALE